jgi:CheY-like chemotaxis protein
MATWTARRSILVVEDEPAVRRLLALVLETRNYYVTMAEDGLQALQQVEISRPDAILLDLKLPNMDGWQVIDSLDEDSHADHIPIITMSAMGKVHAVGERGVKAFLSKPFEIETLLTVLQQVMS